MSEKTDITHVTDGSFEQEVLKSEKPSLVDFWAPWCGPCKAIGPILEEIAKEYKGQVNIFKINVDDNRKTSVAYGIQGIPTMILFKDGRVVNTLVGLVPKEKLERFIIEGSKK